MSDYPPDEEWPDLEDDRAPSSLPMGGAYGPALELLHGARITLDAGLMEPTRVLTAMAARRALSIANDENAPPDADQREALEPLARGELAADAEALLEGLTRLAAFVEGRAHAPP